MAAQYYHGSKKPLAIGTVLQSRFPPEGADQQYRIMLSAIKEGLPIAKALLLVDDATAGESAFPIVFKEIVFELERPEDKPSRIWRTSVYVCPSRHDLAAFQQEETTWNLAYSCELDRDTETFMGDLTWVSTVDPLLPIQDQFDQLAKSAAGYWAGHPKTDQPIWEILVPSGSATITAQV